MNFKEALANVFSCVKNCCVACSSLCLNYCKSRPHTGIKDVIKLYIMRIWLVAAHGNNAPLRGEVFVDQCFVPSLQSCSLHDRLFIAGPSSFCSEHSFPSP